jgi:hypothetical protein
MLSPIEFCTLLAVSTLSAGALPAAQPETPKRSPYVKVSATTEKPSTDGKQELLITLEIDKGVTIFANPAGHEDLKGRETRVKVMAAGKPVEATVTYPAGDTIKDVTVGDYRVYRGTVKIHLSVPRAASDAHPLEVVVFTWGVRPTH